MDGPYNCNVCMDKGLIGSDPAYYVRCSCNAGQKAQHGPKVDLSKVKDLKPRGTKAPLWLLPLTPLKAISAAMEDGATKYAPWNWVGQTDDWRETYASALLRHALAYSDPTQDDYAPDSKIHHLAHAAACILILLHHEGVDYPAKAPEYQRLCPRCKNPMPNRVGDLCDACKREVPRIGPCKKCNGALEFDQGLCAVCIEK